MVHSLPHREITFAPTPRKTIQKSYSWDFPGGPVVKPPGFQSREHEFDPGLGN